MTDPTKQEITEHLELLAPPCSTCHAESARIIRWQRERIEALSGEHICPHCGLRSSDHPKNETPAF